MKVVHDVPGQRLTLEGAAPRIWPAAYALALFAVCLPFVLATLWILPAAFGAEAHLGQKVGAVVLLLFWFFLLLSSARAARETARWPTGLDVDRGRGELRLRESGLFGGVARDVVVPLSEIAQLTVRRTAKAPSLHDPLRPVADGPGVALSFGDAGERGSRRFALQTRVEHLDRPEEVVDLALRLGAAAGLTLFKVVRSDAREAEVELRRQPEAGFETVPLPAGPADYARDVVAPAARTLAGTETIPPFDASTFQSEHRVRAWRPGSLVHFQKPLSPAAVGCLPFALLVFAGPATFFLSHSDDAVGRLIGAGFIGFIGLLVGGAAILVGLDALPRSTRIDWSTRSIGLRAPRTTKRIPLESVRAVEMKVRCHVTHGRNRRVEHSAEVGVLWRDPQAGTVVYEPLVATLRFRGDVDTPYRLMLPLATELARSLGVERRVTDEPAKEVP